MNPADAGRLLTAAALYDNRTISELNAIAWSKALHPTVSVRDGLQAIADHYAETREWIMPADVNGRVRRMRAKRVADLAAPAPPVQLGTAEDIRWRRTYTRALADGASRPEAETIANTELGITPQPLIGPPTPQLAAITNKAATIPDRTKETTP